jgi:hypothetical protein
MLSPILALVFGAVQMAAGGKRIPRLEIFDCFSLAPETAQGYDERFSGESTVSVAFD